MPIPWARPARRTSLHGKASRANTRTRRAGSETILTVRGRKTGRLYSTPVDVIEVGGHRWLVAGYGPASWVMNTRASGEVTLSRGGHTQTYNIEEAGAEDAVPVLRKYIAEIRVTRPYFDATPNSSDEAIAAELPRHAVFRLIPAR
jgi:deazaflavin-dependent oxidoreductase (nitroreductase family)